LYKKLRDQRQKQVADLSKEKLSCFLKDPGSLVSRRVSHKCREPGQPAEWYSGKVTRLVKKNVRDPIKTKFEIIYDVDPDAEWEFPLLSDLGKGDLIVFPQSA
jgi:hypothetical protein